MNPQDIIDQMMRQQNQSVLTRNPTIEELDKFIDKCCNERDETLFTLAQALAFKLQHRPHSLPEGEVYPVVIQRIQERMEKGEK